MILAGLYEGRDTLLYSTILAKCPCVATALEKKIFMTLENNMLVFTYFLRALSLHI
jgi:hypothetical protein